jgi:hypothetical protein
VDVKLLVHCCRGGGLRSLALERERLRLHAESSAVEHLAQTFLPARLRIQTIAFTTTVIGAQHPELGTLLERLERVVDRLTELSQAVTRYASMRLVNLVTRIFSP